jgi:hypothetical protein
MLLSLRYSQTERASSVDGSFTTLIPGGKMSPALWGCTGVVLPRRPSLLFSLLEYSRLL